MTNPTSHFNWQMPTSTDLVTDLPADFEVFGQAVDTDFQYLLGGTTGQILAKTSNTDLDFQWVAQDDSNAIQNAIVDAKGDLIGATAADTPARLAVGANGTVLTADSAEATGIKWATPLAGALTLITTASPSAAAAVNIDNCFSATYQNYIIYTNVSGTAGADYRLKLRVSGTNATTGYVWQTLQANGSSVTASRDATATFLAIGATRTSGRTFNQINIGNPFATAETSYFAFTQDPASSAFIDLRSGCNTNATSYDGMTIDVGSGNFTGSIRVYGVQNS